MPHTKTKTVRIEPETHEQLYELKESSGDTFDGVIKRLLTDGDHDREQVAGIE